MLRSLGYWNGMRLSSLILCIYALTLSIHAQAAPLLKTLVSQSEIPPDCLEDYQHGIELLAEQLSTESGLSDVSTYGPLFDQAMEDLDDKGICSFFLSMGLLDATQSAQQQVLAEWMIDLHLLHQGPAAIQPEQLFQQVYWPRMQHAGLKQDQVRAWWQSDQAVSQSAEALITQLQNFASHQTEAVPFGRFVFLGAPFQVHTLYDFVPDPDGSGMVILNQDLSPQITPGSWQQAAQRLYQGMYDTTLEFLEWKPGLFWGEDSWVWNYDHLKIKETGFERSFRSYLMQARALRLDMEPFHKLYSTTLKYEENRIKAELTALDQSKKALYFAPVIPLTMYFGGALAAKTGWFSVTNFVSGKMMGASLKIAANLSALSSLAVITGFGGAGAYHALKSRPTSTPFHISAFMDQTLYAAMGAFPLAAVAPIYTGLGALGAQQLAIGGRWLLHQGVHLSKEAVRLGAKGSWQAFSKVLWQLPGKSMHLPSAFTKHVVMSWWRYPRLMMAHYGADIALTVAFDVGYRQYFLSDGDRFYYQDSQGVGHYNKQALYSIAGTLILSPVSKPIMLINSMANRWWTYRAMSLVSLVVGIATHMTISGEIDTRRLVFDQLYNATFGTVFGEAERPLHMAIKNMPPGRQIAIIMTMKVLVRKPIENPARIYVQDRFVRGEIRPIYELRRIIEEAYEFRLNDYTDEQLEAALEWAWEDLQTQQRSPDLPTNAFEIVPL